ncbi:MAG: hypothetical protein KIT83_02060 [Bryobacterales bacterium]|nr:hypothetical protein [Bryobacterales bacterium]
MMTKGVNTHGGCGVNTAEGTTRVAPIFPGLALITVGVIALAFRLEWVDPETLGQLWKLWPVALILAGVSELTQWWRKQQ